jgi:hypothetical protein
MYNLAPPNKNACIALVSGSIELGTSMIQQTRFSKIIMNIVRCLESCPYQVEEVRKILQTKLILQNNVVLHQNSD